MKNLFTIIIIIILFVNCDKPCCDNRPNSLSFIFYRTLKDSITIQYNSNTNNNLQTIDFNSYDLLPNDTIDRYNFILSRIDSVVIFYINFAKTKTYSNLKDTLKIRIKDYGNGLGTRLNNPIMLNNIILSINYINNKGYFVNPINQNEFLVLGRFKNNQLLYAFNVDYESYAGGKLFPVLSD